ncbi:MAG: decarboxylating 6-phosphogluconate dehydrogenase [Planctomycetes bacterium]|nr:decarboxylating 6-phosphogluconate dehydrogenase [Planctomycetota bacterium]
MAFKNEFGVIGLGRMGGGLARQALGKKMKVVGLTREGAPQDLVKSGLVEIKKYEEFLKNLERPRAVFVYVPAGPIVDKIIDELAAKLEPGDIVVDGGNSYWGDSIRRHERLKARGVQLVDVGTSGGVTGANNGACFMVGGEREAVARLEPMLLDLAVKDGYVHAGPPGAGHFTKLVHNGIEFGMLQAIGEGMNLLERYRDKLDIPNTLKCWRNGSVIRSWLIDLMHEVYLSEGGVTKVPAFVEDTGEVNWLVNDAIRMEVPVPVISQAVMQLFTSRDERKEWARAIAMMRHGFGGHPYGPNEDIKRERVEGRVGDFYR